MPDAADIKAGLTLSQAVNALDTAFSSAGIVSARLDARLIVCASADIDHAVLIADPHRRIGEDAARLANARALRRLAREPVSRILGHREFWGLDFCLSPAVLDPRPDSETIIEAALAKLAHRRNDPLKILDLGTGTGALLGALLSEFPNAWGIGADLSPGAAIIARANLGRHELSARADIIVTDWGAPIGGVFDLIVSNPPYIPAAGIASLDSDVKDFDPRLALDGGDDGLHAYRAIGRQLPRLLAPGAIAILECGAQQARLVEKIMLAQGLLASDIVKDLAGHDRVLVLKAKSAAP